MKPVLIIALVMMIAIVSGCSENSRQPNIYRTTPEQYDSAHASNSVILENVVISNFAFSPDSLTIQKGTTVVWKNEDNVTHTINSDIGHVASEDILPGEEYEHTFNVPGTYNYHCGIHPSMKGTIIVKND